MPDVSPLFTGCKGAAYSTGYSLRSSSMAAFTRSSSSIRTVLIQVIGPRCASRNFYQRLFSAAGPHVILRCNFRGHLPCGRFPLRHRPESDAEVLVNRLALVVVFGVRLTVRPGDGLRGFVGLETEISRLVLAGFGIIAEAVVAEHQVVMRLQIFGIDRERLFKLFHCVCVTPLQKKHPAQFIAYHTVTRKLLEHGPQMSRRAVVLAIFF